MDEALPLEQIVVAAALAEEGERVGQEDPSVWPGGKQRLRRSSMTMAGTQVFEAMHGETPESLNQAYPEVFANWVKSSSLDLPSDGELLTDKPLPLHTWAKRVVQVSVVLGIVGTATAAAILAVRRVTSWRWLAWSSATLFAVSLDWLVFHVITLCIQHTFRTSQHVVYYISGARQPGARFVAATMSMVSLIALFRHSLHDAGVHIALNILICCVIFTGGLLAAHVATKMLAAHFHRKGFFDRLKTALEEEYYIMSLSKPRGQRMKRKSWTEQMYFSQAKAKPPPKRKTMKLNTNLALHDPKLLLSLEAVEKHVRHNRLKLVFDKCSSVENEGSAKQLAFYIFWNVMEDRSREHLVRSDLEHFLPEKDVDNAFKMLDCDGDGRPTWNECRDAVVEVFKRRKQLTAALHDTGSIVGTLHNILVVVLQVISVFLYLLVWQVDIARVWVTFSSILVASAFVFANSVRTAYENMMFIFVVHPFDVGDILLLEGESHVVTKMKLSNTIFERSSGIRVSYPNNKLAAGPIYNQSRAECVRESYDFAMDLNTPVSTFAAVRKAAEEYIRGHAKDFNGECTCVTTATLDPLKLRLSISVVYAFNHTQGSRLNDVRHGLILVVTKSLVQKGVAYTDPQGMAPAKASHDVSRAAESDDGNHEEEDDDV